MTGFRTKFSLDVLIEPFIKLTIRLVSLGALKSMNKQFKCSANEISDLNGPYLTC